MSRSASITMSVWVVNSPPRNCSAKSPWDKVPGEAQTWRVIRARNKWQPNEDCARHPIPGTYPVVVTGEADWGGWRVPCAEYDLDPSKMEEQARLIANAPRLASFASSLVNWAVPANCTSGLGWSSGGAASSAIIIWDAAAHGRSMC